MLSTLPAFKLSSQTFLLIAAGAAVALAAEPVWKTKPVPAWTEADAKQVLTDSPWSKVVTAGLTRRQNEDQRRDSGNMGQPHGVGFDGVGKPQPGVRIPTPGEIFVTGVYKAPNPESLTLRVRWESALPVRAAELKVGEIAPPTLDGVGYQIAVYGVPGGYFKGDPKTLGDPLRNLASLKREGKKDVKPSRVEVFSGKDGAVVVYLFPPSAELSSKDSVVEFDAQIGRIVISQGFPVPDMEFQGKLEF